MAKHLAPILGNSVATLTRALVDPSDDAEAVVRRCGPAAEAGPRSDHRGRNQEFNEVDLDPPSKRPSAPSPEARARQWLEERLREGLVDVSEFDAAIARHEFDGRSAEQAKAKLGLVARRMANHHGQTVHLCFAAQAAALDVQT
jgi:hypothetical protein